MPLYTAIFTQSSAPIGDTVGIGTVWYDTSVSPPARKQCTALGPVVWTQTVPSLTSGYTPVTQLGSGTPNGLKFLRDDQVWAVPSAALPDLVLIALSTNEANQTVTAGYGAYIPGGTYEIGSGFTLEIAATAVLEIG